MYCTVVLYCTVVMYHALHPAHPRRRLYEQQAGLPEAQPVVLPLLVLPPAAAETVCAVGVALM